MAYTAKLCKPRGNKNCMKNGENEGDPHRSVFLQHHRISRNTSIFWLHTHIDRLFQVQWIDCYWHCHVQGREFLLFWSCELIELSQVCKESLRLLTNRSEEMREILISTRLCLQVKQISSICIFLFPLLIFYSSQASIALSYLGRHAQWQSFRTLKLLFDFRVPRGSASFDVSIW